MSAILFDTLRLSRTLRDKGHFTADQADALAEALGDATQSDIATKSDLAAVQSSLRTEIAELKTELKGDIGELRAELKDDISALRTELKDDISALRAELKNDVGALRTELSELRGEFKNEISKTTVNLAETKADILKWIIGAIGFQTVIVIGTILSLARLFQK